jgi:ribosomal protein S18 acetylase RimI-like enzyme
MTGLTLPAGYRAARPTPADAAAIDGLLTEVETAALGRADHTLADVEDELVEPDFDADRDGWLVYAPDGRLVGWAWAWRKGDSDNVDVAVYTSATETDALADELWRAVLARGVEQAREAGHPQAVLDAQAYRGDARQAARLAREGFAPATVFHRLLIDHAGPRPAPATPPGVTVRDGAADERVRRDGHAVREESFAEHFGVVATGYDQWVEALTASSAHDWAQLRVVYVGDEPAAMLLGADTFVPDDNCGYVRSLGVRKPYRGRGLARYLLRLAFADDAARGRAGTYLHVDTAGEPAMGLYLSEGMREVLGIEVHRRTVSTS